MATFNTTNMISGVGNAIIHTVPGDAQENGAGTFYLGGSQTAIYVKTDGGDQIITTITVPVIYRRFDTGFQSS
jgi:hypothetical protein